MKDAPEGPILPAADDIDAILCSLPAMNDNGQIVTQGPVDLQGKSVFLLIEKGKVPVFINTNLSNRKKKASVRARPLQPPVRPGSCP